MSEPGTKKSLFDALPLPILVRYAYSGFLAAGLTLFAAPEWSRGVIESGGAIVTPLVILAFGACIYVLYRHVLGESEPVNEMRHSPLEDYCTKSSIT